MGPVSLTKDRIRSLFIRLNLHGVGLKCFPKGCILPLLFHNPNKELFAGVIESLLNNGFTFLSTDELMDIIKGKVVFRKKAVWLTFDDGHRGNIDHVLPTLIRFSLPAIFFLPSTPIEDEEGVTWVRLARENRTLLPVTFEQLLNIPEEQRKAIMERVKNADRNRLPRQLMTKSEVLDISRLPFVTIGSHTANHVVMPNCTDAELEREIAESTQLLSAWIGKSVHYFSYPFNRFEGRVKSVLIRHGYTIAATSLRTVMDMHSNCGIDPFKIPRVAVDDEGDLSRIVYRISTLCLVHRMKNIHRTRR
jgi:poly-beta-1,6-N-acetyl-D-glucosamine N-deacetylase